MYPYIASWIGNVQCSAVVYYIFLFLNHIKHLNTDLKLYCNASVTAEWLHVELQGNACGRDSYV